MKPQFITDSAGRKISAVLPIKQFELIIDQLDELACIKAYDKASSKKQKFISAKEAFRDLEKKRS